MVTVLAIALRLAPPNLDGFAKFAQIALGLLALAFSSLRGRRSAKGDFGHFLADAQYPNGLKQQINAR